MNIPDEYKVKHLFLLIGENTLPNYVAARLLLEDQGTVYLIHTTKTREFADLLQKQLEVLALNPQLVSLGGAEADGYIIRQKIKDKIKPKGKPPLQGKIGLNYTGGTKAMAVHAYQAILEFTEDSIFSYLDSHTLQMCFDDNQQKKTIFIPIALELSPPPKFENILALHNLSWQEQPISTSQVPDVAQELAILHLNFNIAKSWRKWCNKAFESLKDKKERWLEDSDFPKPPHLKLRNETVEIPEEIKQILKDNLQCIFLHEISLNIIKNKAKFANLGQVCQWLNGGWLEDYVLFQVENIAEKYNIHEHLMSLRIKDPNQPKRTTDQFEFDIAFLRGYQLFGISCTTSSDHKDCKQKLFEAHLRARQLGGDEARVALVCCYDYPTEQLKKELDFIVNNDKIEVFGRNDLDPDQFAQKLDKWLFRNAGK